MTTPAPDEGWLTLGDLRAYAQVVEVEGQALDTRLADVRAAVMAFVEDNRRDLWSPRFNVADAVYRPTATVKQGAILLAARLLARKGTPLGTQSYGEFATAILRSDPDIGLMLGLGRNAKPACR